MDKRSLDKPRAGNGGRLSSGQRREQILKFAQALFAATGLRATKIATLASAAGISEALLCAHFGTKQRLFEEVVERNTQQRLASLEDRFSSIPNVPPLECIEQMAEATILACTDGEGNASVMAWALMEAPEFAADVYRAEVGATEAMWDSEICRRFADSPVRTRLAVHLLPYAVHACMAFGFWLAALRHQPATAGAHARQYAEGLANAARAVVTSPSAPLVLVGSRLLPQVELAG